MKKLLLLATLILTFSIQAQNWQWVDYLSGGGSHSYYGMDLSNDNQYVYGVGRYRTSAIFYGQDGNIEYPYHAGSRDAFLIKIDTAGNYQWVNTEGGPLTEYGFDVTVDEFDNIYMTGITYDTAYFGTQQIISHNAKSSVYVAKYAPDGQLIWAKNWESPGNDSGAKIESDKNGAIYITGYQGGGFDYGTGVLADKGFFIGKLDHDGNFIWCKGPDNNLNTASASNGKALFLYENDIYVGGNFKKTVNFGNIPLNTPGNLPNIFFCKLDSSGTFEWARSVSSINTSDCRDLTILDSNIYIIGSYSGTAQFDTIQKTSNQIGTTSSDASNSQDAYLAKYNFNGSSCHWVKEQKSLYNDITYSVDKNKHNNIIVTGTYNYDPSINFAEMRIIEYTQNGDMNWIYSPVGNNISSSISFVVDKDNNYYAAGSIRNDYFFQPSTTVPSNTLINTAIIGRLYPPITKQDSSLSICSQDSIYFSLNNVNGSSLDYQWFENSTQIINNNDTLFTSPNNLDSIWCIVSNGTETDTSYFFITDNSISFSLGQDTSTCDNQSVITLSAPSNYQNFLWSTGETTSTIDVNISDTYYVDISNTFNCTASDSVNVTFLNCIGILNNNAAEIQYFVSETNNLTVVTDDIYFTIEIFNLNGKILAKYTNETKINLSHLSKGVYIATYNGSIIENKKIVLQ